MRMTGAFYQWAVDLAQRDRVAEQTLILIVMLALVYLLAVHRSRFRPWWWFAVVGVFYGTLVFFAFVIR